MKKQAKNTLKTHRRIEKNARRHARRPTRTSNRATPQPRRKQQDVVWLRLGDNRMLCQKEATGDSAHGKTPRSAAKSAETVVRVWKPAQIEGKGSNAGMAGAGATRATATLAGK